MKRRRFIRYLEKNGRRFLREGGRHSVYFNPTTNKTSTVPRHNEVVDQLTQKFVKIWAFRPWNKIVSAGHVPNVTCGFYFHKAKVSSAG